MRIAHVHFDSFAFVRTTALAHRVAEAERLVDNF